MNTSLSPTLTVIFLSGILLALVFFTMAFRARPGRRKLVFSSAFLIFVPSVIALAFLNPWLVDGRYSTYRSFYQDIEVGMTRDDVLSLMDTHYPPTSSRKRPQIMEDTKQNFGFFMNPENKNHPNCEGIFLSLESGRIKEKIYLPD